MTIEPVSDFCELDGVRLHFLRWEATRSGTPVVLVHGLGSNARIWNQTAGFLANDGLAVVAPDLRGHGRSSKPARGYSFEAMAEDVRGLLKRIGVGRPLLVGHSWGAYLALEYALLKPRGRLSPAGLVLVDGGVVQLDDLPGATWGSVRETLAPPIWNGIRREALVARLGDPRRAFPIRGQALEAALANFRFHPDGSVAPRLSRRHHMRLLHALWQFPTYHVLAQVACPVLILPVRPPAPVSPLDLLHLESKRRGIERAREVIRRVEVEWMVNSHHDLPLQRPRKLAKAIAEFARANP